MKSPLIRLLFMFIATCLSANAMAYGQCSEGLGVPKGKSIIWKPGLSKSSERSGDICIEVPADFVVLNTYCAAFYGWGRNPGRNDCILNQRCNEWEEASFQSFRDTTEGNTRKICVNYNNRNYRIGGMFFVRGYRP